MLLMYIMPRPSHNIAAKGSILPTGEHLTDGESSVARLCHCIRLSRTPGRANQCPAHDDVGGDNERSDGQSNEVAIVQALDS